MHAQLVYLVRYYVGVRGRSIGGLLAGIGGHGEVDGWDVRSPNHGFDLVGVGVGHCKISLTAHGAFRAFLRQPILNVWVHNCLGIFAFLRLFRLECSLPTKFCRCLFNTPFMSRRERSLSAWSRRVRSLSAKLSSFIGGPATPVATPRRGNRGH